MFLTLVMKRSSYLLFEICLQQIWRHFFSNFDQSFLALIFLSFGFYGMQSLSSFFNTSLMLKNFKLRINSYGNVNKEVSFKNYLTLSQDYLLCKSILRKFDLSCGIRMYHFKRLLPCVKGNIETKKIVTLC